MNRLMLDFKMSRQLLTTIKPYRCSKPVPQGKQLKFFQGVKKLWITQSVLQVTNQHT